MSILIQRANKNNGILEVEQLTKLGRHIEAILFVAEQEVTAKEIEQVLVKNFGEEEINAEVVQNALEELEKQYKSDDYSFYLVNISDGYRLLTKGEFHKTVSLYLGIKSKKKLSRAAMETLAIVAYRQPISKGQIEAIRGVSSDYGIQKLLEKELIEITGRSEAVGRPLLYGTSKMFMDHFGLKSLSDLPKLKEVIPQHNQIGDEKSIEEIQAELDKQLKEKLENNGTAQKEEQSETELEGQNGQQNGVEGEQKEVVEGKAELEGQKGEGGNEGQEPGGQNGVEGEQEEIVEGKTELEREEGEGGTEGEEPEEKPEVPENEMGGEDGEEEQAQIEVDEGIFEAENEIIAEGVESHQPEAEAIEGQEDGPHEPKRIREEDLSDEIE